MDGTDLYPVSLLQIFFRKLKLRFWDKFVEESMPLFVQLMYKF